MVKKGLILLAAVFLLGCGDDGPDGPEAPAGDMTGTWFTKNVVSGCDDPDITEFETFQIVQTGNDLDVTLLETSERFSGQIFGNDITWTATLEDDDGTTTLSFSGTLSQNGTHASGEAEWTWTDGTVSCDGATTVDTLLEQDDTADVSGTWEGTTESKTSFTCLERDTETGLCVRKDDHPGDVDFTIEQHGPWLTGSISAVSEDIKGVVDKELSGTVSGDRVTFGDSTGYISFDGTIGSGHLEGYYDYLSSIDWGEWEADRTAP